MTEIRFLNNQELNEAADLSDSVFRSSEQTSMRVAFPHIFSPGSNQSAGAFEDGKLVAFMGLVPKIIHIGLSKLQVYCLGSVCTAPEFRGKGYASRILEQIYAFIKQTGASLLLVSGGGPLYTRFGCVNFGVVRRYAITANETEMDDRLHRDSRIRFRLYDDKDIFQLHRLSMQSKVRYEESLNEKAQLIKSEAFASIFKLNHKVYVAELDGKLIASVIVAAQVNYAHAEPFIVEWHGVASIAVSLISYAIRQLSLQKVYLNSPWQESDMHEALNAISFTQIDNLGTIRIMDFRKLWDQIQPHLIEKNANAASVIELLQSDDPEIITLSIAGDVMKISHDEFVSLLFDPHANLPSLKSNQSVIQSLFPIAFPYTAGLHFI